MAVRVYCDDPDNLLEAIKTSIEARKVKTWTLDSTGDLTHAAEQWANKAWFRPRPSDQKLLLNILGNKREVMTRKTYALYHGSLIEMLLTHFDSEFDRAIATSGLDIGDTGGRD